MANGNLRFSYCSSFALRFVGGTRISLPQSPKTPHSAMGARRIRRRGIEGRREGLLDPREEGGGSVLAIGGGGGVLDYPFRESAHAPLDRSRSKNTLRRASSAMVAAILCSTVVAAAKPFFQFAISRALDRRRRLFDFQFSAPVATLVCWFVQGMSSFPSFTAGIGRSEAPSRRRPTLSPLWR